MNQVAAAAELKVTPRSLRDWAKKPGFPDCSKGYDLTAIRAWRDSRRRRVVAVTSKYRVPAVDDWTAEDWKDLFLLMKHFQRRLAERHERRAKQGQPRE